MPTKIRCIVKFLPLLFVCLIATIQPATAWDRKGHAAIASIAEANLTPAARAQVKELLKDDLDANNQPSGRTTLPEVASWPDEIRKTAPENTYRGWHTRSSNSVCSGNLGWCWQGECVDRKLLHYAAVLKNTGAPPRERNEALKWVVHLVGDLHTPLHSGSNHDMAGKVHVLLEGAKSRRKTSLHWVWDHDLANAALDAAPVMATLKTTEPLPPDAVMQWMEETRKVSRKHVYDPLPGFSCGANLVEPVLLDREYQRQAMPVIRLQIERAGLRLAQLLNELLK
jgi:hypothetical protein